MSVEEVMVKEPDNFPPEALNDDEPRYLRRQKPVEVRRKFGRKTWPIYRRVLVGGAVTLAGVFVLGVAARFFLFSPAVRLASLDQVEVTGNHFVPGATVAAAFVPDLGRSVLRVPLEDRRKELAAMPWVAQVWVKRDLPNRIRVELVERTPIAFLRLPNDLALIDANGVILDRPLSAEFHFPVVSGISDSTPADARALRMKMFAEFMKEIEIVRSDAADHVSEADLSDEQDVRATLTGIGNEDGPVLVHFGDSDFGNRYRLLTENIDQWRQSAGRVDSVDLRFARQVVVNPESGTSARAMPADEAGVK
ncbi:MAG TPA: FtsQ-type POTRA domain-containing protein [Methylomirabilota bacterium]|nr:FtsQ-type POTRA domain-containing protein [Methylomirabilota bacterium]